MPEEQDEAFEPLPALTEPPEAEEELELQDALADPVEVPDEADAPTPLGRAPAYDFAEHRLVPGAAGGPLMTRGIATLATWTEKCLRTRRGENAAVDPDFGCDVLVEDLLGEGEPFDPSAVAEYISGIERALTVHPRITGVNDVDVDGGQDDDGVFVTFTVAIDDEETPELTFDRLAMGG